MKIKNNNSYNLYSIERIFKNETLISYYFQPNRKIIKKISPIDIDGVLFYKLKGWHFVLINI